MKVSHSRIETFVKCPYQYKLRYIDELKTYPENDPADPLIIGTALHTGIEKDTKTAISEYYDSFPIITDRHIEESIKLEWVIAKCKEILPAGGEFEVKIEIPDEFLGFIDYLVPVGNNEYDMYDFKYSNNVANYMRSGQLHEYKFYFEKINPDKRIRKMYFLFAPKVQIKMKYKNKTNPRDETLEEFRKRLTEELKDKEAQLHEVTYDSLKVKEFIYNKRALESATVFDKNVSNLCRWCEFQEFCLTGSDLNIDWSQTKFKCDKNYLRSEK